MGRHILPIYGEGQEGSSSDNSHTLPQWSASRPLPRHPRNDEHDSNPALGGEGARRCKTESMTFGRELVSSPLHAYLLDEGAEK